MRLAMIRRQGAVGVAEHEERVGPLGGQHGLGLAQDVAERGAQRGDVHVEHVVGQAQAQLLEEDLVELVVPVLAGVHEHVLDARGGVEAAHHGGQPDDLRARADHGQDLHDHTSSGIVSGLAGS